MDIETKKKTFLEMYKVLCEEYGMYVTAYYGQTPSDTGICVEEALSEQELETHIKELEETS